MPTSGMLRRKAQLAWSASAIARHVAVASACAALVIVATNAIGALGTAVAHLDFQLDTSILSRAPEFVAPPNRPFLFIDPTRWWPIVAKVLTPQGVQLLFGLLGVLALAALARLSIGVAGGRSGAIWFWVVAAATLVIAFGLFVIAAAFGIRIGMTAGAWVWTWCLRHNFTICVVPLLARMAPWLRKTFRDALTWKILQDKWLKLASTTAMVSGLGFGVVGYEKLSLLNGFVSMRLDLSELPPGAFLVCYAIVGALYVWANLYVLEGVKKDNEDSNTPEPLFANAFRCAWGANLGAWSLTLNGIVLTLYSHFARP